jgi:apolipoprotein N-acyltransferase
LVFILSGFGVGFGYPYNEDQHSFWAPLIGNTLFYWMLLNYFLCKNFSTKKLIYGTCLCIWAGNIAGFSWVPATISLFSQLEGIVAFLVGVVFVLCSCPPIWTIILFSYFCKRPKYSDLIKSQYRKYSVLFPVIVAAIITFIGEFTPFVFPVKIGSSWISIAPYITFAPIFGLAFYSFLTHWISLEVIKYLRTKIVPVESLVLMFTILIIHFLNPITPFSKGKDVKVRIVQANIESEVKFLKKSSQRRNWDELWPRYKVPSETNLPGDLDLLIWPETAYPFFINSTKWSTFSRQFVDISKKSGNLLFGGVDHIGNKKHVASFLFSNGEMNKAYHKRKLILFAEFLPLGPLSKYVRDYLPGVANFTHGTNTPTFNIGNDKTFITPICYEILFIDYLRDSLNESKEKVNFFVNMANDAWFRSSQEVHQHEFMARWTALIFQKPVVRSLNTGRSSLIRNDGVITHRLGNLEAGVLNGKILINPSEPESIYQKFGLWGFFFLLIGLIGFQLLLKKLRSLIKAI